MKSNRPTHYFGTTVKVGATVGIIYLLWWLWQNKPWKGPGHGGINPWGGGGNADQGAKPTDRSNTDTSGKGPADMPKGTSPTNDSGGQFDSNIAVIITKDGSYSRHDDGKYYNDDTGELYTGSVNGIWSIDMPRTDFITTYYTAALRAQKMSGVFPETMFAQAILESSGPDGSVGGGHAAQYANNLFNIVADSSWSGDVYRAPDGNQYRSYDTVEDSIADYYTFLRGNSRYDNALSANSPKEQINAIAAAGYAEDPNYGTKLNSLLPLIMAAESTVKVPDDNYTPSAVDVAVNTDKEVEKAGEPGPTKMDSFTASILEHKTTIKWVLGIGFILAVSYVATDGYKKNPLKRLLAA